MSSDKFIEKYNLKAPVCLYKLGWSSNKILDGQTHSCHRVAPDIVSHENYDSFHNTPSKIEDRILMQNGEWPENKEGTGCQYCKKIEEKGEYSDRKLINNSINFDYYVPKEVKDNSKSIYTTPTMLEVYFNNLCNQACIYCNAKLSSLWEAEDKKYQTNTDVVKHLEKNRKNYPLMLQAHWDWLKNNIHLLKMYNILGGEPLFQKEFEDNLNFFIDNKAPNLDVGVFTNLKIDRKRLITILDKIQNLLDNNHIKSFTFFCSLDCWGPQQEYIRFGLNLNQWEDNFNSILNNYKSINLAIHSTITNLAFDTLYTLCKKVESWNNFRHIRHSISIVDGLDYLHPNIFINGFFKDRIYNIVNNIQNSNLIPQLINFEKSFNLKASDNELIAKLKFKLSELDNRRNTNWKTLWPWLNNYEI